MNHPLICRIEIGAELITGESNGVRRVNLSYHSTNLMSGQLNLIPNKYIPSKLHELVVDETVLKAFNEYGTQFTLNTQLIQLDKKQVKKQGKPNQPAFLSFHQADIHIPSVYNEHELIMNQLNELAETEHMKNQQQQQQQNLDMREVSSSIFDVYSSKTGVTAGMTMPHSMVKKDPARAHHGFQFTLDLNKLKLVHSETYQQLKQQMTLEDKIKFGMKSGIVVRKPAVHFKQAFAQLNAKRKEHTDRKGKKSDRRRARSRDGSQHDGNDGGDSASNSRPSSVEPAPHHYNHPEWHLDHDYEASAREPIEKIFKPLHEKLMLESKIHTVINYDKIKDSKKSPLFIGDHIYKRIQIPSVYQRTHSNHDQGRKGQGKEDSSSTEKKKSVLDYGYAAYMENQTKNYKKTKKIEFEKDKPSAKVNNPGYTINAMIKTPNFNRKNVQFNDNGNSDEEEDVGQHGRKKHHHHHYRKGSKKPVLEIPDLNTDFLYKRAQSTYRKNMGELEWDGPESKNTTLTTDKITVSWAPLLLGQPELTRVFPLKSNYNTKLKITIKITGPWLNQNLIQILKPVFIQVKTIENLPETPISQAELAKKARPIHIVLGAFGLKLPCYGQQRPERAPKVNFCNGKIIFLGLLKESINLRECLSISRMTIEIHDRDWRRNVDDSNERLTDDANEYPHGIACIDMKTLLKPGTLHKIRSQIVPSRTTVTTKIPQGHYIENGAYVNIEISTPYPYFQNFKMRPMNLKDRANKYHKVVFYGLVPHFKKFMASFLDWESLGLCGSLVNDTELNYLMVEGTLDVIDSLMIQAAKYNLDSILDPKYVSEYRDWKGPIINIDLGVPVDQFITNVKIHIQNKASFESLQFLSHLQMLKECKFTDTLNSVNEFKQIIYYFNQLKHVRFNELVDLTLLVPSLKSNLYRSQLFGSVFLSSPSIQHVNHQQQSQNRHGSGDGRRGFRKEFNLAT